MSFVLRHPPTFFYPLSRELAGKEYGAPSSEGRKGLLLLPSFDACPILPLDALLFPRRQNNSLARSALVTGRTTDATGYSVARGYKEKQEGIKSRRTLLLFHFL